MSRVLDEIGTDYHIITLCGYLAEDQQINQLVHGVDIQTFRLAAEPSILVSTAKRICVGENPQKALYIIHNSNEYSVLVRLQSGGRIWKGTAKNTRARMRI